MEHKPKGQMGIAKTRATLQILRANKKLYMSARQIAEMMDKSHSNSDITTIGTICNVLFGAGLVYRDETFKGKSMRVVFRAKDQNESV
jgi:phage regulator Rha-like protein